MAIRIITTEDSSHSLYDDERKETYHSNRGAISESLHVFIRNGLHYMHRKGLKSMRILEIGFGTGLNALLSYSYSIKHPLNILYESLEPYPISLKIASKLNYVQTIEEQNIFSKMHRSPWENPIRLSKNFELLKRHSKLEDFNTDTKYHLIYFDGFSPSKQPEIWHRKNLAKCFYVLETDGILTTYCAQGQFKRSLVAVGFVTKSLTGAIGKKEMVRATKP